MTCNLTWNGKLSAQGPWLEEPQLFTLVRIHHSTVSVSVSDGNCYWFGQGDETSIATAVKVSKSRLEIVADTLKQPSEEMTVLLTAGDKETTNVLYFKVMRVVLSGLPLPVVSVELCRQAGTSFLENIWDTLSRLRTKMEEQESRIRRQETINQELQRVLELTREEKDKIEKRLLTKFMRLLNEKKRKIQQLEQFHHNTNDRCPKA